eukprot:COSAG05_NODE_6033_length_1038_cov_0.978701_2_plen_161_part_00
MKFAPDKPAWIIDAQDTLDFRTEAMGDQLDTLLAEGKTMEQVKIHIIDNARIKTVGKSQSCMVFKLPMIADSFNNERAALQCSGGRRSDQRAPTTTVHSWIIAVSLSLTEESVQVLKGAMKGLGLSALLGKTRPAKAAMITIPKDMMTVPKEQIDAVDGV